jgi:7-keto-8-aminopelargonate synthetase-like enzyme
MLTMESFSGNTIQSEGRQYSYFAGNNYLGLANHPELIRAANEGIRNYGLNFAASRQTTGTSAIHLELEGLLARFKQQDDAIVFASGYLGNKILLQALKGDYDAIFADQSAHSSVIDGFPSDISNIYFYEHRNVIDLEHIIRKHKSIKPLVITDGIFALTGEIAPLNEIYPIVEKYNGLLVVDDAHATGVLGENGKGTPEYFHLDHSPRIFQTETMSKAIGVYGGFISANKAVVQKIRENSHVYGASTALPPPMVAAACAAIKLIANEPERREKMLMNALKIREGVKDLGYNTTNSVAPIIPLMFDNQNDASGLSDYLKTKGMIAPFVTYPVKTVQYIVRITVSATHTEQQINELLNALEVWKKW